MKTALIVPVPGAANILAAAKAAGVKGAFVKRVGRRGREMRTYMVTTALASGYMATTRYDIIAFPTEHS